MLVARFAIDEAMNEADRQKLLLAAQQAKDKNIINIIKKVNKERPLSKAEQSMLDEYLTLAHANPTEPHARYGHLPEWSTNKVDGAVLLNIPHRSKFSTWRRTFPDAPEEHPNGKENLWKWYDFIDRHNLRESFRNEIDDPIEKRKHAESRKLEVQAQLYEEKLKQVRGASIDVKEMRRVIVASITELKSKLAAAGNVLAPKVAFAAGDTEKSKEIINDYIHDVLTQLSRSKYISCECPACGAKLVQGVMPDASSN
jgi:hypothetical protein